MYVGAGIAAAAVVGGAASIYSSNQAASAQRDAANQSAGSAEIGSLAQMNQYIQNRADHQPWLNAGAQALSQLGPQTYDGGDLNRDFTMADFQKDPGYQFRMDEANKAIQRSASAKGNVLGGGTLKALTRYNQDYASSEFSNAYNRFNNDRTTRYNRLANLAGLGQTAANQIGQSGTNMANQLTANNQYIGNTALASGNASAANSIATGNAINNSIGSLANGYMGNQMMNKMFPSDTSGNYTVSNGGTWSLDN